MDSSLLEKRPWLKNYDWKTPWTVNYPRVPAYYILRTTCHTWPNKAATWFYGSEITYRELYSLVTRLANGLIEMGVQQGDRIGLMLPNSPQFVIAYWAILMAGATAVNISPLYTVPEVKSTVQSTELKGIFTFDPMVPLVKQLSQDFDIPIVVVTRLTDFVNGAPVSSKQELGLEDNWHHFSELMEKCQNDSPPLVPIDPEDPAVIQFTGGTTGVPKGATLTNYNIVAAAHSVALWSVGLVDNIPFERRRVMCTLPFFHVYGQVCCILYGAFTGATLIVLPRFDVDEVFDTLHKFEQINYWPCVPTMLTAIVNHPRATEIDWFKKVDYIVLGAAPSPSQLIAKAEKLDCTFHPGWGMSETASLGICNPYGRPKLNSIGVPFIDVDVRIVDPDTLQDVERGKPGEIWVKSPYVMKGYWNSPEETAKVFTKDGWLRTGDVAYMDEEGYIFIVDRTKDIIIAGGYNIYPNEIDEVLLRHPKVKDAITIGIPDEYRGETVKSFVQLAVGVDCTAEELIAYCRENLAAYKIPRFIEFREELPRTNVGKAMRRLLREEEMAKGKA